MNYIKAIVVFTFLVSTQAFANCDHTPGKNYRTVWSDIVIVPAGGPQEHKSTLRFVKLLLPSIASEIQWGTYMKDESDGKPWEKSYCAQGTDCRWARFINPDVKNVPDGKLITVQLANWSDNTTRLARICATYRFRY